ncbi:helix-turn-helix domain-containing protein [Streptomyces yaizuensis]|uniref:Transcriptional regulator n=1 Tax=Streptomyces yaizuensis TaxID=2989713 RepID=A0ABQ5PB62_9ACTN|nr:helix-turn-helix transcriptional regulator [Streptomyces sp. YSPA8]GLF99839.1 transcriptional regulator [Streptomyces sp. YSPA8]
MGTQSQGPGTEAFARRLREIREASGRSYGALARRIGVSGSTLHRYCSGHTVPMEFAPVERFARFCGCQGEELVALHSLWLAADRERTLRQEAAGTLPKSAPRPVRESERESVPDSVPEPAPAAGTEAGTEPAMAADVLAGPAGPVTAGEPRQPEVTVVLAERPRPGARDRRRPRPLLIGAAAVVTAVCVLVTLLTLDGSLFGNSGDSREPGTALVPDGGRASAPDPDPDPDPDPSPDRSAPTASPSGKPSPSASASAPPRPTASRGPSAGAVTATGAAGGATGPRASTGPPAPVRKPDGPLPFTVSTDQHAWEAGCNHTYLVDRKPGAVPPPPVAADARPWASALGAVHGRDTLVRFTVQGRGEEAVVLQALRVRVVARRAPLPYNAFRMDSGCGGALTERTFAVDLDKPRPVARPVPGVDGEKDIPAVSFPYRVSAKDPEVLLATATTAGCDCEWYLELEWSSGDRSGTTRIDNGGRPFRTSAAGGRPSYDYDHGARRWAPSTWTKD